MDAFYVSIFTIYIYLFIYIFFSSTNFCSSLSRIFSAPHSKGLIWSTGLQDILLTPISYFCKWEGLECRPDCLLTTFAPYLSYSSPRTLPCLPSLSPSPLLPHSNGLMEIIQSRQEMKSPRLCQIISAQVRGGIERQPGHTSFFYFC